MVTDAQTKPAVIANNEKVIRDILLSAPQVLTPFGNVIYMYKTLFEKSHVWNKKNN